MSDAKFTQGPWKHKDQPFFGRWGIYQHPENWNGMGFQEICSVPSSKKGTHYGDMFRANADLITAAPDMYAALNQIASLNPTDEIPESIKSICTEALKKARGEK